MADDAPPSTARALWQAPLLLLGVALLIGGVVVGVLTRPKPDYSTLVDAAARLVEDAEFEAALAHLNEKVLPYVGKSGFSPELRARFHVLRARSIAMGQRKLGLDRADNHEKVVGEFGEAERFGTELAPLDVQVLAEAYIALERYDRALARAHALPSSAEPIRQDIEHRVILAKLNAPDLDFDGTLDLLTELLAREDISKSERGWALARQAELLSKAGQKDEAIRRLLRSMPVMADAEPGDRGLLHLILGRSYLEQGAIAEASNQLDWARELLPEGDENRGEAIVLQGRIAQTRGDLSQARDHFALVVASYSGTPAAVKASLGIGEVEAAGENDDGAVEAFEVVLAAITQGRSNAEVTREVAAERLMAIYSDRMSADRWTPALRFATMAEDFFGFDDAPTPVLKGIADVRRRLAEDSLRPLDEQPGVLLALEQVDPATREEARRNLLEAGRYYRAHANRVVLSDNAAYADSLWLAADSFDLAGEQDETIRGFADYMTSFPYDSRHAQATYRLAQAQQARGDYEQAARLYAELIEAGRIGSQALRGAELGPYGDMSYVPLAQTYLLDADPGNDEEAERLLRQVVDGRVGDPQTRHFREATIALGSLLYDRGRYAEAIEVLTGAMARYAEDARLDGLVFKLADSHRLEASAIERTLGEAMPDQQRRELEESRHERLTSALELYERVRNSLEAKDPRRRTPLEDLYLRNATFYLGACAFDLRDFDAAIRAYDAARERYPNDPSSLVAMMQIVNAYLEQGDLTRAATANERARRFYQRFPAEVWSDPYLPLSDKEWERWIDSSARLTAAVPAGNAGGAGGSP